MDCSEARLDRIEVQRSMDVSQEQWKQRYIPMNLIKNGLRTLSSRGLLQAREAGTTPPLEDIESEPEFFINLKFSDLFDLPGEYVPMNAEMFSALSDGNEEWLEKLRSHETPMACLRSDRGDSVLHLVAAWGHLEGVKTIVSEFMCLLLEPNSKDQLPLHVAAGAGHSDIVEALVATMTFVSVKSSEEERDRLNPYVLKDRDGNTPLHAALKGRHMKSALCLVNANQRASFLANKEGISPLYLAVEVGDVILVKAMLKTTRKGGCKWRKTNLDSQLEGRKYLGHAALKSMNTDILDVILSEYPSLVDELDEEGRSCLSFGATMGYCEGVSNLLERSTKGVFVCDDDGSFPSHKAVEKGHLGVVTEILKRCPYSKHLLNKQGQNILHVAASSGKFLIVHYLMGSEQTKDLANEQDVDGNTPLHLATLKWRPRSVCYLPGPKNILIQNNSGLTALDIADLSLQPHYIFRETLTLLALVRYHARSDARYKQTMTLTRLQAPIYRDGSKEYINALIVVAALVATVTFAAGFTLPGGFKTSNPNLGMATLATDFRLIFFLLFDIVAMQSSVIAIVSLLWAQLGDPAVFHTSLKMALQFLFFALYFMGLAFFFGMIIAAGNVIPLVVVIYLITVFFSTTALSIFAPHVFLLRHGAHIPGPWVSVMFCFVNDDEDESYQSSTHSSVKRADSVENQVEMPDTT